MPFECFKWNTCGVKWNEANWKWNECLLVEEIIQFYHAGVPGEEAQPEWIRPPWAESEKKKRILVELICRVKGEKYDQTKELKEIKININDVKLVVKKVSGVELNIVEKDKHV